MGKLKPWQAVLFVVAAVTVVGMLYYTLSGGDGVAPANSVTLVDPNTGDLFYAKPGGTRGLVIPATNPNTGTATLIPAMQQDGKWFVNMRYFGAVNQPGAKLGALVSRETGEVRVVNDTPAKLP